MICEPCQLDAQVQRNNMILIKEGLVMFRGELEPGEGHDGCKGCDCQHKPVKEGQIKGE